MLLESMPFLMKQQQRPMGQGAGPGGYRQHGGKPGGPMRNNNRGYNNQMGGNRGPGQVMHPQQMQQMQQQMGGGNMQMVAHPQQHAQMQQMQ
jgi:hypothetical protein